MSVIEIKVARRLRKHLGNPKFKALSERLDALRDRFEVACGRGIVREGVQLHSTVLLRFPEVPRNPDAIEGQVPQVRERLWRARLRKRATMDLFSRNEINCLGLRYYSASSSGLY